MQYILHLYTLTIIGMGSILLKRKSDNKLQQTWRPSQAADTWMGSHGGCVFLKMLHVYHVQLEEACDQCLKLVLVIDIMCKS